MSIFDDICKAADKFIEENLLVVAAYTFVGFLFYLNLEKPNERRKGYGGKEY